MRYRVTATKKNTDRPYRSSAEVPYNGKVICDGVHDAKEVLAMGCFQNLSGVCEAKMDHSSPENIDEYIKRYPKRVQAILRKIRATIKKATPHATEAISYQIPTFKLGGNLVHFAAFADHISFFPTSSGVEKFKKELNAFETSKGTIRFPLEKPIPYGLITRITKYRVKEALEKRKRKIK